MIKCNLAVLLAERNIKISELSKRTGISRTTLTALTQNQSKGIQFDTFDTLCNFLNVKPNDLFIQEQFDYDFEVNDIVEEISPNGLLGYIAVTTAEINYLNKISHYEFHCYVSSWSRNSFEPDKITDININPSFPQEIINILNSIPITFKVSFEQELFEALKAELVVNLNLDEDTVDFQFQNHYY